MPADMMEVLNLQPEANPQLAETKINSATVYQGDFLALQKDTVSLPDGQQATREYLRHPGAVVILPVFDDGSVLLERQFRYPLNQVFIEFPAGKIDPNEDSLVCAQRELLEETGYRAQEWQLLCTIHNAIAYCDEHLDIYLARGLIAGEAKLDEEEFLEVFRAPLAQLLDWVKTGNVTDVKTVIGAFWLEKIRDGAWP